MLRSLRFRLPALFLAGVALAGIISTAVAVRLFQDHIRTQTLSELRREATGLTRLYVEQAIRTNEEPLSHAPSFAAAELERATGDKLFYVGVPIFPGQPSGLRSLPQSEVDWLTLQSGKEVSFEFTPKGFDRSYLAVAHPLRLEQGAPVFGALVVAKPNTALREGWVTLIKLLGLALAIGVLAAALLAWWLSRRIANPVLGLARAADEVARGNYRVEVPVVR